MRASFYEYEEAIRSAQRTYHNYQEWDEEQYGPIDTIRTRLHVAIDAALAKHQSGR